MKIRNESMKSTLTLMLTVASFFAGSVTAMAQEETAKTAAIFGSVGVAFGQSVQLNVANTETADPRVPPDPIEPVEAELRIINGDGAIVIRELFNIAPGATKSIFINADELPRGTDRLDLRGLVMISHPNRDFDIRLIVPTMEVIDSDTRRSSIVLHPASLVGFNPQPEPPRDAIPPDDTNPRSGTPPDDTSPRGGIPPDDGRTGNTANYGTQ